MTKTLRLLPIAALAIALGACTNDPTLNRTAIGAGGGAALGGLVGSMSGNFGTGALIGAGVGAAGGLLYDYNRRSQGR